MSVLELKKLPKGWIYGLTPKHVRGMLRELQADFKVVEFCGTRHPVVLRDGPTLLLGQLNCRAGDDAWCFRLRLWGAPADILEPHRQRVHDMLVDAIGSTVASLRSSQVDASLKPRDQELTIKVREGDVVGCFRCVDRDSFGLSIDDSNRWWQA